MMVKYKSIINAAIGFVIMVAVWQSIIIIIGDYEAALFPAPLQVWDGILSLIKDGTLFVHFQVSSMRFFAGYLSAVVTAIILGLTLGRIPALWGIIDPVLFQVLRPVSPIAWSPFIVLWFGIGDIPAIVIIFIAAFFPVLLSTVAAVRKVDKTYLKVAQNFEIKSLSYYEKLSFQPHFLILQMGSILP